jgi:hypothetical protein
MASRERLATACAPREPDRLPVDFGGGFQTGMHVSIVYWLRQALGLDPPGLPVRVVEVYAFARSIGADGFSDNANGAIRLARPLLGTRSVL